MELPSAGHWADWGAGAGVCLPRLMVFDSWFWPVLVLVWWGDVIYHISLRIVFRSLFFPQVIAHIFILSHLHFCLTTCPPAVGTVLHCTVLCCSAH